MLETVVRNIFFVSFAVHATASVYIIAIRGRMKVFGIVDWISLIAFLCAFGSLIGTKLMGIK